MNATPIYELMYHSLAEDGITEQEIQNILETSHRFNGQHNITGCLIFYRNEFVQLLEGDKKTVQALFEHISRDKRHRSVTLVYENEIPERNFSGWTMAFKQVKGGADAKCASHISLSEVKEMLSITGGQTTAKSLFGYMAEDILRH